MDMASTMLPDVCVTPKGGTPRVSILIAAYNAAGKVSGSVNSVLAQSIKDVEVIVVDDCSSDATSDVVNQLQLSDPRVHLVRRIANGGPGAARNTGLAVARGEWVAVVDADDSMDPRRLEVLLDAAEQHDLDLVADNIWLVDDHSGNRFDVMFPPSHLPVPRLISAEEFVRNNRPTSVKRKYGLLKPVFRRSFLETHGIRYMEDGFLGEDFLLYLDCLIRGARFMLLPEAHYFYQVSRGSLSHTRSLEQAATFIRQCDALLSRPDVQGSPGLARALRERSEELRRDFVYLQFVTAFKRRQFSNLVKVVSANPHLVPYIGAQALRVIRLRLRQFAATVRARSGAATGHPKLPGHHR